MKNLNNSLGAIVLTNCWKLLQNNLNSKVFQPPTPELQSKSKHCASENIHHSKNVVHLKCILWTRNNLIHWHFSWLHNFNSSYNEHLECRAGFDYCCFYLKLHVMMMGKGSGQLVTNTQYPNRRCGHSCCSPTAHSSLQFLRIC